MITVRYYAAARELAGARVETFPLEGELDEAGLRARLAARHPALAPHLGRMRFAVNGELEPPRAVRPGDEVDVLPPVAGGAAVALCRVEAAPISVDEAMDAVGHPGAGGVAIFVGVVRDHADGKVVARLDYEAHPTLAEKEMRRVLEEVAAELPGVRLAALHRVGELAVGDRAVIVAASAPHRAEAFEACRRAIDRIKASAPIWKKEWDASGRANWVNLE
jgi:molybdopterin synthase catalytic subunit